MAKDDSKDPFNRIANPDGWPLRDKDNDAPQLRPQMQYSRPAPNLAPSGAMGIRTGLGQAQVREADPPPLDPEAKLTFTSAINADPMRYYTGDMPTMPGYSFLARVNDAPTPYGMEEGRIEQLVLKHDDEVVARYNHGRWIGALPDLLPLKLRKDRQVAIEHSPYCSSRVDTLRDRDEVHTVLPEIIQNLQQVQHRPA
ncbi:DUF7678 domain-containing protein [Rhodophyticola sp. CCM32]|uniref:DUF7678 domain-containing protein n=1 Tax=Rhodophyticola sp. CCM32 TaxID=2916397 RepID=UPI001EE52E9A|nr:hypothetical protein [Rhodophyticola sp. CCM32]